MTSEQICRRKRHFKRKTSEEPFGQQKMQIVNFFNCQYLLVCMFCALASFFLRARWTYLRGMPFFQATHQYVFHFCFSEKKAIYNVSDAFSSATPICPRGIKKQELCDPFDPCDRRSGEIQVSFVDFLKSQQHQQQNVCTNHADRTGKKQ